MPFQGEIALDDFKGKPIRKVFRDGEWFFSISDVVGAIVETERPAKYWSDLKRKRKLSNEGFDQLSENIGQLKMPALDGKEYMTDAANAETLFRIIQSVGSPKAEPLKKWLAKVAFERLQEFQNPELAIQRAMLELVLTMLGETSTAELARARDAQGFGENKDAAQDGGKIAGDARKNFETQLGQPVVSRSNFLPTKGDQGELPSP